MLVDTHCHIHEAKYPLDIGDVMSRAHHAGVSKLICVGTNEKDSRDALSFANNHDNVFASIGVHPHDTKELEDGIWNIEFGRLLRADSQLPHSNRKIVAIGEIGLDYFYTHSPRKVQIEALTAQVELALKHDLPIIFHVRDAFDDFWPIFDRFQSAGQRIRGVLHSFTDNQTNLDEALKRNLFIGVNGISTFTKNEAQKELFATIPIEKLLLETDAPFLTPAPYRGKVNEPAFVRQVGEDQAIVRKIAFEDVAKHTTANATALFAL